jgi:trimeric autotransporter adhesin
VDGIEGQARRQLRRHAALCLQAALAMAILSLVGGSTARATSAGTVPITVAISGSGSGSVTGARGHLACPSTCSIQVKIASLITLIASSARDSAFAGWTQGCVGATPSCVVYADSPITIGVSFDPLGQLDAVVSGDGMVSGAGLNCGPQSLVGAMAPVCQLTSYQGAMITLTATAGPDSVFAGWGGACAASAASDSCKVTAGASTDVEAAFGLLTPVGSQVVTTQGVARWSLPTSRLILPTATSTTGTATAAATTTGTATSTKTSTATPANTTTTTPTIEYCRVCTFTTTTGGTTATTTTKTPSRELCRVCILGESGAPPTLTTISCSTNTTTTGTAAASATTTGTATATTTTTGTATATTTTGGTATPANCTSLLWSGACVGYGPTCLVVVDHPTTVHSGPFTPTLASCPSAAVATRLEQSAAQGPCQQPQQGSVSYTDNTGSTVTCGSSGDTGAPSLYVTVTESGGGIVTGTCSVSCGQGEAQCVANVTAGTPLTFTATDNGAHHFVRWTKASLCQRKKATCMFTATFSRKLVAVFTSK